MNTQLAFVFPGQGSQTVGMLKEYAEYPIVKHTFQEAHDYLGYDLWDLIYNGPDAQLNQTEYTQPALLAVSVALWRIWRQQLEGHAPALLAGHSLGEYSALVCANAIAFKDAITLVALRGKLMQEAVREGEGAMAAIIGLSDDKIAEICSESASAGIISPANYNAIGQTVVAGSTAAVELAVTLAQQAGSKMAKKIPVSVPSHCALMKPAAEQLSKVLETIEIAKPTLPVIQNVDVCTHEEPAAIRAALVQQLYSPVRWVETIQFMAQKGIQIVIECGPGKVLAGLNKRIESSISTQSIATPDALQQALENTHSTLKMRSLISD